MLRRTPTVKGQFTYKYFGPTTPFPPEYYGRIANKKPIELTKPRDPKNAWGLHNKEWTSAHPSQAGIDRYNFSLYERRGGPILDTPPVPVYRKHVYCTGTQKNTPNHPVFHMVIRPNQTAICKYCRVKYINMMDEENDDTNWRAEIHKIATTPEPMTEVLLPTRMMDGVLPMSNFQDGNVPCPLTYKSVYYPEKYTWKTVNRKRVPPSQWRVIEAEEKAKLAAGGKSIEAGQSKVSP